MFGFSFWQRFVFVVQLVGSEPAKVSLTLCTVDLSLPAHGKHPIKCGGSFFFFHVRGVIWLQAGLRGRVVAKLA